jgi:hypothetical protein
MLLAGREKSTAKGIFTMIRTNQRPTTVVVGTGMAGAKVVEELLA